MQAYIKKIREQSEIVRRKAEQEAHEARQKQWVEYEKRKLEEEENRRKQAKIDQTINKIANSVSSVSKSCEATGTCVEQIAKMKKAATALKSKLESTESTATDWVCKSFVSDLVIPLLKTYWQAGQKGQGYQNPINCDYKDENEKLMS